MRRVTRMIGEISTASQQQLTGIEQVSHTVTQMDRVVQQNAALVSQSAAAASNLADHAQQLMASVARFRVDDGIPFDLPGPGATVPRSRAA